MKKIKKGLRIITAVCAALGWWGLLYPELTLTPDTVRVICEDGNGGEISADCQGLLDNNLYLDLLGTDRSNIRFRSRLLTELSAFWEAFSWEKSTQD